MRANIIYGGGDSVDYDELTATRSDVPEGLTFLGHNSDGDPETGELPNMQNMHSAPGYSENRPDIPIHQATFIGYTLDTSGDEKIVFTVPHGVYPGDDSAYVGCDPEDIGLNADVIANGHETAGIVGTYGSDGNLQAKHLITGEVGYGANGKVIGSAANRGAVTRTLSAGESYTINEGFFSDGKITAKDLTSQTVGTAAAGNILKNFIAWVNGTRIVGTMKHITDDASITYTSDNGTKVVVGDACFVSKNSDNVDRFQVRYNGTQGFITPNTLFAIGLDKLRSALELTAAKIKKGESIAGITGTWYGNKKAIKAFAARGFGTSSNSWITSDSESFTMPANGTVYYGGATGDYNGSGSGTCRIYKNGTVVDNRDVTGNSYNWRGTMVNKSFSANAGDVITVEATAPSGSTVLCFIQAVIVY
ncbi:hypothetical protein BXO88_09900 [Oribacterium sp. C9]|uniref:hypothetical protein n=1 Tax=Oribacterium sp. C9 TaxID=1943579 RepID=UPI00098FFCF7|nr:hypothetical protein [Oribacterium sp. C9]OON85929.1 hypothetical protein BXO88_09900 [Oribacterium sp. C9]